MKPSTLLALLLLVPVHGALADGAPTLIGEFNFDGSAQGFSPRVEVFPYWIYTQNTLTEPILPGLSDGALADGVWSTNTDEAYQRDSNMGLVSPLLSLDSEAELILELWHMYSTQGGGDGGQFLWEVDGSAQVLAPFAGYPGYMDGGQGPLVAFSGESEGWIRSYFQIPPFEGDSELRFELSFLSNGTDNDYAGWHIERARIWEGDAIPPHFGPAHLPQNNANYLDEQVLSVDIFDDHGIDTAWVHFHAGDEEWRTLPLVAEGFGDSYSGALPAQLPDSTVEYYFEAIDEAGNRSFLPGRPGDGEASGYFSYSIALAAPDTPQFQGEPGRLATEVTITWPGIVSDVLPDAYRVYVEHPSDDSNSLGTLQQLAQVNSSGSIETYSFLIDGFTGSDIRISALYPHPEMNDMVFESLLSGPLHLDVVNPKLLLLEPGYGYQGQDVWVEILAENADFASSRVGLETPEGIELQTLQVINSQRIKALLSIQADAAIGVGILEANVDGSNRGSIDFEVLDASDRPRILSVSPPVVSQGSNLRVKFEGQATDFRADTPSVDFGMGISVLGVEIDDDGGGFSAEIEVDKQCPVGQRAVRVVSGDLVLTDIPFEITRTGLSITSCSNGPISPTEPSAMGLFLMALLGVFFRRFARQ